MKKHKSINEKEELGKKLLKQRKKVLLGLMDILILNWLRKQPLSGQDIKEKIKKAFTFSLGPGTLYPILHNLRDKGLIKAKTHRKRKIYSLTKKGKDFSRKVQQEYFKIQKPILNFLK